MITGQLMPGFMVKLDHRTAAHSGSWIPNSGNPLQAYDQDIIQLFFGRIKTLFPLTVLDIGASTGSFCLLAKWIPQMTCIAIEPTRSVHEILECNVKLNGLEPQVVIPRTLAFSDYVGKGLLKVPLDTTCSGLSFIDDRPIDSGWRRELVEVCTLDKFTTARVDAIKLDVEHSEEKVLRGGEALIRQWRPLILLEATLPQTTIPLLKSWGYRITDYQTDLLATHET